MAVIARVLCAKIRCWVGVEVDAADGFKIRRSSRTGASRLIRSAQPGVEYNLNLFTGVNLYRLEFPGDLNA